MDSSSKKYQVIARKYRPQTFASVVGQEAIVTTLKNALRFNRLAHAYLFCGCRGTGKTTLARVFAKALNCSNLTQDGEPCNSCTSCLDIIAGRSLDVLEIDGASNRGIDDIRQINETIGYAPAGKYKIYIIDEVHMLTKEAFNALLKTLEEPPANVKFFFATTEPHKVLPTIISRCQRFDLNRIPPEALKTKLAWIAEDLKVSCEEEVFSLIAGLSEGSLRDAESLLDQIICYAEHPITAAKVAATLGIMPQLVFFALDKAFDEHNLSYAFELAGDIFASGKDLSYFLDNLVEHYRRLLKLKLGSSEPFATTKLKEQYTASAGLYSEEQCLYILDFLIHWQQQVGKTPFKRVSLEMILLHVIRSKQRVALPSLVKRLVELEQKNPLPAPAPAEVALDDKILSSGRVEIDANLKVSEIKHVRQDSKESETNEHVQAEASPTPQLPQENESLEETLLKKLKEKIQAATPPKEEAPREVVTAPEQPKPAPGLVLTKSQWQAAASEKQYLNPVPEAPVAEQKKQTSTPIASGSQSRYETLVRFAAVELEGTIKKEQL